MSDSDQDLIDRCLNGEQEAFGQIVQRYQQRLYVSVVRLVSSTEDALDITQETFLQAYRKLDSFRGEAALYSWLFRIAYNTAMSKGRKKSHPTFSIDRVREESGQELTDEDPNLPPSHRMELTEEQELLWAAIESLSAEFRQVIVLKEMEGLSYDEIAQIANCPVGTVRSRLHRARMELRGKLERCLEKSSDSTSTQT